MKYLVLGSEGQVGGELCKYLRNLNHEVIEFDITKDNNQDLRVKDSLIGYIESCDFVFFLAFDVGGSRYLKKYQKAVHDGPEGEIYLISDFIPFKRRGKKTITTWEEAELSATRLSGYLSWETKTQNLV